MRRKETENENAGNRGATGLPLKRRTGNPMTEFDRLPPELRAWMCQATLPWSPHSCLKIWEQSRAKGEEVSQIILRLNRAEQRTLERAL